ncbi:MULTISPECIES: FliI/YscN family ATPase [Cupriavidus]
MTDSVHPVLRALRDFDPVPRFGLVTRLRATAIEADGPPSALGAVCEIGAKDGCIRAEVIGVERGRIVLAPYGSAAAVRLGDRVHKSLGGHGVRVGEGFLGRVLDPFGVPIDGAGPVGGATRLQPLAGYPPGPLDRLPPSARLDTGIRALDTLLPLAKGQRVGLFAGSGVGKTSLLGGLARHVEADHCVLCLIGERGREAEELWREALPEATRRRSVMVLATSDLSAALRARAMWTALAHAEALSQQGAHVLFLVDSITRFAMALREIGLSAGEPPTVRAYPPSVFGLLPKVVERCGVFRARGAITAIMTILAESDEIDDPMAETMRSLLDGHIVLSRDLAERGHYPAIEITRSVSRAAQRVETPQDTALRLEAVSLLACYEGAKLLVESGAYAAGSDSLTDRAIELYPALLEFLRQDLGEAVPASTASATLMRVLKGAR